MKPSLAALAIVIAPSILHADGERGPMFGGGVVATHNSDADVAGIGAELVLWYGRIGIAAEAARQWSVENVNGPQVGSVTGSLRLLAFEAIVPSLLDGREVVELGIELQGLAERTWWADAPMEREPYSYGFGVALRLRGANDDDRSNMLAESRIFVRALYARGSDDDFAARDTMPTAKSDGVSVLLGVGALFGGGQPAYVERLRRNNTLDSEWLVR